MWSRSLKKTSGIDPGTKWTWHVRRDSGDAGCRVGMKLDDEVRDSPPGEDGENRICLACQNWLRRQSEPPRYVLVNTGRG